MPPPSTFTSRRLGTLPFSPTDGAYAPALALTVNGRPTTCSLFIGPGWAQDPSVLARAAALVDDHLDRLDLDGRAALASDATGLVADFVAFHLEELDAAAITRVLGRAPGEIDRATFLAGLQLVAIGLHPDAAAAGGFTLNLDYSLGRDLSDQLLVARFDDAGQQIRIAHES